MSNAHVGREALFDFAAQRLHPDAAAWIEAHVAGCARCAGLLARVEAVRGALAVPAETPFRRPADLAAVRRRLERPRRRNQWLAQLAFGSVGVASALAVLLLVRRPAPATALAWSVLAREGAADVELGGEHAPVQANLPLPSTGVLAVQPEARVVGRWGGARVAVESTDAVGARVALVTSRSDERQLRLERGRVVLDVDPLPRGATLTVITDDARVSVRGTRFLVEKSASGTSVAVEHGLVRVQGAAGTIDVSGGARLGAQASRPTPLLPDEARTLGRVPTSDGLERGAIETLDVFCDVAQAEIAVDGVLHGRPPLSLAVAAGPHRVRVSAPGRLPFEERVEVVAGTPTLLSAELEELREAELPAAAPGSLAAPTPARAADLLRQARGEVLQGAYARALARLEALRRGPLSATEDARAALLAAQAYRLDRRPERALALLDEVARGDSHEAEQAEIVRAQTLGRDLADPRRAAAAWSESLRRFPRGIFHEEAAYRVGEALLAAGELRAGLDAVERYLADFPAGAHASDAHLAVAAARRDRLGDCRGAVSHLAQVAAGQGPRAELARVGEARCDKALGLADDARFAYERYLAVAPRGRYADEARSYLRAGE